MRLLITEPMRIVADLPDIRSLRGEDASGSFGVLPGHIDLLTTLVDTVLSWKDKAGQEQYCAVRQGILTVTAGENIAIATREAHLGDNLATMEKIVVEGLAAREEAERQSRTAAAKVRMRAIRQIVRALRDDRRPSEFQQ